MEVTSRITGFLASLLLTFLAYFMIISPGFFNFDQKTAVVSILALAFVQSIVQLIFFIHVWKEEGTLWNLSVFISTASIIFIIIFFSMWIINHLNEHMQ